jgi:hypothetical protein
MPKMNIRTTFRLSASLFNIDMEDIFDEELEFDPTFKFNSGGQETELFEDYSEVIEVDEESDEVVFFSFYSFDFKLNAFRGSKTASEELANLANSVVAGCATLTISDQIYSSDKTELCHTALTMDSYEVGEDFEELLGEYREFVDKNGLYPEDRLKLAQDLKTDSHTLSLLAMDKNFEIRMAVAIHSNTSEETLEMISDELDREDWVSEEYINEECPDWGLKLEPDYIYNDFSQWRQYAEDCNDEIREAISER